MAILWPISNIWSCQKDTKYWSVLWRLMRTCMTAGWAEPESQCISETKRWSNRLLLISVVHHFMVRWYNIRGVMVKIQSMEPMVLVNFKAATNPGFKGYMMEIVDYEYGSIRSHTWCCFMVSTEKRWCNQSQLWLRIQYYWLKSLASIIGD